MNESMNKATRNPITLDVRPHTYSPIPTHLSARARDTTRAGLVITFPLWCSELDTVSDTAGSVKVPHLIRTDLWPFWGWWLCRV